MLSGLCYTICPETYNPVVTMCMQDCTAFNKVDCGGLCVTDHSVCNEHLKTTINDFFGLIPAGFNPADLTKQAAQFSSDLAYGSC